MRTVGKTYPVYHVNVILSLFVVLQKKKKKTDAIRTNPKRTMNDTVYYIWLNFRISR